ncbi:HDOD domain-containing protein [Vibrio genomosp. F6]|uniref:HDOD domain-containing protein n=1 Tax=Vibrio genomosp. F6 str. FF-238 TaxID=1191298 RepID=A0A1E5D885_9VIBR|nr:HDOD domain-containing protein [Vibrio genomosp. F6]OEE79450.1 hypothetical protein A130_02305 [Vibrio genomosp. F6 str. FF-238]
MLLTNKRYTPQAREMANRVTTEVSERYAKWLINPKYIVDQNDVDKRLSLQDRFCDDVIFDENDRITRNQRILLECEQSRIKEKDEKLATKQKTLKSAIDKVSMIAEQMMCEKLASDEMNRLFGRVPDFGELASFAYSPSLSFRKLGELLDNSHQLSSSVLDFVNTSGSERSSNSSKGIVDAKTALGLIGIDNCRLLFPVLMARPLLRWSDKNTNHMAPKMWQHLVVTSNVTRMRLQETDVKCPEVGVLLGTLRTMSMFVMSNLCSQVFEDALVYVMTKYREVGLKDEYYACADIQPSLIFLPSVIRKMDKNLTERLLNEIEWKPTTIHLKNAIIEDLENVEIEERSAYGAALGQAHKFSIYDAMQRSEAFQDKHKPYWFSTVQMPGAALTNIKTRSPGKLTYAL